MNRRLTRACLASAAMVRGSPALMAASSAVRTRRVLAAESRRRSSVSLRVRPAVASSATAAAAGGGPAFDGGEERRWLRAGQAAQFGGEGDVQGGSLGADRGDGLVDGGAVVVVQGGEDFVVGAEQSADRVDFFVGGGGVGAGPVGQGRDRGGQAFPVGQ